MTASYYNEWDASAAAWLRELINNKLIPYGYVDERSITEVTPSDLEGFTQCHFFAGIGGWPLALQLAGIPASTQLWTGSPPCQPFSVAGKSLGFLSRHSFVFFGAMQLGDTNSERHNWQHALLQREGQKDMPEATRTGEAGRVADANDTRPQGWEGMLERAYKQPAGAGSVEGWTNPHHGFWSDADWIGCRDGKFRPVEAWTQQMADGVH